MNSADLIALIKKQPIGFGCGVLCLICGVLLYLRSDKIPDGQKDLETRSAQAAKILANVRNSAKLPDQVAEIQALTKEMESRLVHAGQLAVNLQYFYKLEAENEVKLMDVRQNNPPKNPKTLYVGVPYNVTVQGSYNQVLAFLQRLESGRHFCRINGITFAKGAGAIEGPAQATGMTLTLTLQLLGQP